MKNSNIGLTKIISAGLSLLALFWSNNISASWDSEIAIDQMTDVKTTSFTTKSQSTISTRNGNQYVYITAECSTNSKFNFFVDWRQRISQKSPNILQARIDKNKVKEYQAKVLSDKKYQIVYQSENLFKDMFHGNTLRLRTLDANGANTEIATFKLTGLPNHFVETCTTLDELKTRQAIETRTLEQKRRRAEHRIMEQEKMLRAERTRLDFMRYRSALHDAINNGWPKPDGLSGDSTCSINIKQTDSGKILEVEVSACSSGGETMRDSIKKAILSASPLPTLKNKNILDKNFEVTFRF